MKNITYWIVVGNARNIRILESVDVITKKKIKQIKEFEWQASRQHDSDLVTDKAGQHSDMSYYHNSFSNENSPHKNEKKHFAEIAAEFINEGAISTQFDKLILIASPEFLGQLRLHLSKNSANHVTKEFNKDLTHYNNNEIVEYLIAH